VNKLDIDPGSKYRSRPACSVPPPS
jgi:hypothetical protein